MIQFFHSSFTQYVYTLYKWVKVLETTHCDFKDWIKIHRQVGKVFKSCRNTSEAILFSSSCIPSEQQIFSKVGLLYQQLYCFQSMSERHSFERRLERRSFSRERKVSAAQFLKKERKVSAVHKNWWARAQNALFFSALFYSTLPVKLWNNENFLLVFHSFIVFKIFFSILHMQLTAFRGKSIVYFD